MNNVEIWKRINALPEAKQQELCSKYQWVEEIRELGYEVFDDVLF